MGAHADVVIAGSGMAGSVTAVHLARAGASVCLVERAEFPRDKPCGEGLMPHGLAKLAELGLGDLVGRCGAQPFRGILFRCDGVSASGDFESGAAGRGVRRLLLDAALREAAARQDGVMTVRGAVRHAWANESGAGVKLSGGDAIEAGFLIGADGPRSAVRHALGLDGGAPRSPRYAIRGHYRLAVGTPMPDRVEVSMLDGYELYLTPAAPGVVGVAALVERHLLGNEHGSAAERLVALAAGCPAIAARLAGAVPEGEVIACGPLRVRARAVHRGRALLVGDAAGYVDAITGEGMSLALRTAELAARAVIAVLRDGRALAREMNTYARARAAIFREHAIVTHAMVWLARHPRLARRTIARLAREPALFCRMLAVNNGTRSLLSLSLLDFVKLAVGSAQL